MTTIKKILCTVALGGVLLSGQMHGMDAIRQAIENNAALNAIFSFGPVVAISVWGEMLREKEDDAKKRAEFLEEQYSDLVTDLSAFGAAASFFLAAAWVKGRPISTAFDSVIKTGIGALTYFTVSTETCGNILRKIPAIGGLLADNRDKDGNEQFRARRLARSIIAYVLLKEAALAADVIAS